MELWTVIRRIELFEGLTKEELNEITTICHERRFSRGERLAIEGDIGDNLFIIMEGLVEVLVKKRNDSSHVVVNLGEGQLIGEMSLVDKGPRSATVRSIHHLTIAQEIKHQDFHALCERNSRIGYIVMKNLAADLSFKLRHRHLSDTRGLE
jgi:CRP-like cAMP-binding protein